MAESSDARLTANLADEMLKRRGTRYPAHAFIAEKFPDYVKVLIDLDEVIRVKPRRYDEKMHELFHIIALAVEMSNPTSQPHLKQHIKKGLQVLTYGVTCMLEALEELKHEAKESRA